MLLAFIKYYITAKTKYEIHSPFVFDWLNNALEDTRYYYAFAQIAALRSGLLKNKNTISVTDLGAGSRSGAGTQRAIDAIARTAVSPAEQCELIFRTLHWFKSKNVLEFGTSLGVATAYQAAVNAAVPVVTMEGCPNIAAIARSNFKALGLENVTVLVGDFDANLPVAISRLKQLDCVFFDGNHRREPTLRYFEACLPYAHNDSLFIFDDIHWSDEMEAAWAEIKAHKSVTLTIDLFSMGFVFFRAEQKTKEHFTIIAARHKPWSAGFFSS